MTRKPVNPEGLAGLVLHREHADVFVAAEQGVDVGGLRYAVICEHGSIVGESNKRRAAVSAQYPANFCEECREAYGMERDLVAEFLNGRKP